MRSPIAVLTPNRAGETIGLYAVAFLEAARVLFGQAADGRGMQDLTFYPAAYNLRHGVELFMKQACIFYAYELRDPSALYSTGHSLTQWSAAAAYLRDTVGTQPDDKYLHHIDVITSLVEELQDLDPHGTLLRYPEFVKEKKGERLRQDTHVPFDAVNMNDWVAKADAGLSAAQALLYAAEERVTHIRHCRGESPEPLSELVGSYASP